MNQQNQQNPIIGFVQQIGTRQAAGKQAYSAKVNGTWYGHGFTYPQFQEGDEIEFLPSYNGQYVNIDTNTVRVLSSGGQGNQGGPNNQPQQGGQGNQQGNQAYNPQRNSNQNYQQQGGGNPQGNGNGGGGYRQPQQQHQQQQQQSNRAGQQPAQSGSRQQSGRDKYWEDKAEADKVTQRIITFQASRNAALSMADMLLTHKLVSVPQAKAKQYDAVLALVDELTGRFVKQVNSVEAGDLGDALRSMEQPEDLGQQQQQQQPDQSYSQGNGYDDDIPQ